MSVKTPKKTIKSLILSGRSWAEEFPTSRNVADLNQPFKDNVWSFLAALKAGAAAFVINATYRPKERAYLMHYAFRIAREGMDPRKVPGRGNVDIGWVHRNANGQFDMPASRNAAEEMVNAFGIAFRPALLSNHTQRTPIDMTISWKGTLSIIDGQRNLVVIKSNPKSGQNAELAEVGKSYKVLKLISDPPHWSENGR